MRTAINFRFPRIFLLAFLVLNLAACDTSKATRSITGQLSDLQESVERYVDFMDGFIAPSSLADESLQESPWISSKVKVDSLDRFVSLDWIDSYLNAYRYYTGQELAKEASDLVGLLDQDNEDTYSAFEDFFKWLMNNGPAKRSIYVRGTMSAYLAYKELHDEDFKNKELPQLEALDHYELALWAVENPEAGGQLEEDEKTHFEALIRMYRSN